MNERQRMHNVIRDPSPCLGCTERFTACSDNCPKDARGEYGHNAWKAEIDRVKETRRRYLSRTNVRMKGYNEGENYGRQN